MAYRALSLVVLSTLIAPAHGVFSLQGNMDVVKVPTFVRSNLLWKEYVHEVNFTLVSIVSDQALFDYCDLNRYTPEGIAPLLQVHGLNNSTRWAATFIISDPTLSIANMCPGL